jgi:hypothetical protein
MKKYQLKTIKFNSLGATPCQTLRNHGGKRREGTDAAANLQATMQVQGHCL